MLFLDKTETEIEAGQVADDQMKLLCTRKVTEHNLLDQKSIINHPNFYVKTAGAKLYIVVVICCCRGSRRSCCC